MQRTDYVVLIYSSALLMIITKCECRRHAQIPLNIPGQAADTDILQGMLRKSKSRNPSRSRWLDAARVENQILEKEHGVPQYGPDTPLSQEQIMYAISEFLKSREPRELARIHKFMEVNDLAGMEHEALLLNDNLDGSSDMEKQLQSLPGSMGDYFRDVSEDKGAELYAEENDELAPLPYEFQTKNAPPILNQPSFVDEEKPKHMGLPGNMVDVELVNRILSQQREHDSLQASLDIEAQGSNYMPPGIPAMVANQPAKNDQEVLEILASQNQGGGHVGSLADKAQITDLAKDLYEQLRVKSGQQGAGKMLGNPSIPGVYPINENHAKVGPAKLGMAKTAVESSAGLGINLAKSDDLADKQHLQLVDAKDGKGNALTGDGGQNSPEVTNGTGKQPPAKASDLLTQAQVKANARGPKLTSEHKEELLTALRTVLGAVVEEANKPEHLKDGQNLAKEIGARDADGEYTYYTEDEFLPKDTMGGGSREKREEKNATKKHKKSKAEGLVKEEDLPLVDKWNVRLWRKRNSVYAFMSLTWAAALVLCCLVVLAMKCCGEMIKVIWNRMCMTCDRIRGRDPNYRVFAENLERIGLDAPTYAQYVQLRDAVGLQDIGKV